MNNKIKELMELSAAVDVICNEVEKSNKEKEKAIEGKLKDKWNAMWDDIETFIPAVEMLRPKESYIHVGKYKYGYPYGFDYWMEYGITFIVTPDKPIEVFMDYGGGWSEIKRNSFDYWMTYRKSCVEELLSHWRKDGKYDAYAQMEKDIEKRLAENIKRKAIECQKRTEELDCKLKE